MYCRDDKYYYKFPGNGKRKAKDDEDWNEHLVDKDMTFLVDGLVNPAFVNDDGASIQVGLISHASMTLFGISSALRTAFLCMQLYHNADHRNWRGEREVHRHA